MSFDERPRCGLRAGIGLSLGDPPAPVGTRVRQRPATRVPILRAGVDVYSQGREVGHDPGLAVVTGRRPTPTRVAYLRDGWGVGRLPSSRRTEGHPGSYGGSRRFPCPRLGCRPDSDWVRPGWTRGLRDSGGYHDRGVGVVLTGDPKSEDARDRGYEGQGRGGGWADKVAHKRFTEVLVGRDFALPRPGTGALPTSDHLGVGEGVGHGGPRGVRGGRLSLGVGTEV